jgi:osmotically-inducible protein OsmY
LVLFGKLPRKRALGSPPMNRTTHLIAAIGSLLLWVTAGAQNPGTGQPVNDSQISARVSAALAQADPELGHRVQVTTMDGVVTLTGQVTTGDMEALALRAAGSVNGVTKVLNRMRFVS